MWLSEDVVADPTIGIQQERLPNLMVRNLEDREETLSLVYDLFEVVRS